MPSTSGFVYIWFDRKHKRFYIGSHWGSEDDSYVCSSPWMKQAYKRRRDDFRRKTLKVITTSRADLLIEEQRWLSMIKPEEMTSKNNTQGQRLENVRYYNLTNKAWESWHSTPEGIQTIGQKISAAKTGRKTGPFSEERKRAISEAKKRKFAERRALTGQSYSDETMKVWDGCNAGKKPTPETSAKRSASLKLAWAEGRHRNKNS